MANNEDMIKEAEYYLQNDVNVDEASKALGISRRTFQLHMKKLESIAPDKFKLVTDKKENNIRQGNIKGGSLGKRGPKWTREEAMASAKEMLGKEMTYKDAERVLGIPKSTLHEMLHSGVDDEQTLSLLYALAEANRRGMSLQEFAQYHGSTHVSSDIVAKEIKEQEIFGKGNK